MTVALVKATANTNVPTPTAHSREFLERQAFEAFKAFLCAMQNAITWGDQATAAIAEPASDET